MPLSDCSPFILLSRWDAFLATLFTRCVCLAKPLSLNRAKVNVSPITTGLAQTLKLPSVSVLGVKGLFPAVPTSPRTVKEHKRD